MTTQETQTLKQPGIFSQARNLGFWFKKVAAHPCCWLPLATGGSVQLFGAHNAALELGLGIGLLVAIEEGSRFLRHRFSKAAGICPSCNVSRSASYSIALPLFLGSYLLAHQLYPNHGAHSDAHSQDHAQLHIEAQHPERYAPKIAPRHDHNH